jgi:hypothetical protein
VLAGKAAVLAGQSALLGYIPGWEGQPGAGFVLQNGGQHLFLSGNGWLRFK